MATGEITLPLQDGPFTRLIDSGFGPEGSYRYAENLYPFSAETGDRLVGRPGRWRTNLSPLIAPVPGSGIRLIQAVGALVLPFVRWTFAIVDGACYTYNWIADTWQGGPLAAALATAGITIQTTERVYLTQLRDGLLVSDGVNTPWIWNGLGFLAGNLTKLTNCPPLLGRPRLRGGRIYGIKALDPTKLVWSEVDLPNTGYEAGGYNNVWRVTQSNPNLLTALDADNEGLTLFRRRSSTRIYGDDPQQFVTGNESDTLDEHVGVISPDAVVPFRRGAVVMDADLKIQWLRPDAAGALPLWRGFQRTIAEGAKRRAAVGNGSVELMSRGVIGVHYTAADLLLFASRGFTASGADQSPDGVPESVIFALDAREEAPAPVPVGVWRGLGNIQAMAMVRDDTSAESNEYLMFGADGDIFVLGDPSEDIWDDDYNDPETTPRAIRHIFESRPLGYSVTGEKFFDRVAISGGAPTAQTLAVSVIAPQATAPEQTLTLPAQLDANDDVKGELGTDGQGRWGRVRIVHMAPAEQFGLNAVTVTAIADGREPRGR